MESAERRELIHWLQGCISEMNVPNGRGYFLGTIFPANIDWMEKHLAEFNPGHKNLESAMWCIKQIKEIDKRGN